jgi:hypothetical protein
MRLVLPVLLIAYGALVVAMQVPALISSTSRHRRSPAQRRKSWTWLHVGMLNAGSGKVVWSEVQLITGHGHHEDGMNHLRAEGRRRGTRKHSSRA